MRFKEVGRLPRQDFAIDTNQITFAPNCFEVDSHAAANLESALRYLTWSICFVSFTALLFANTGIFQTMAVLVFLLAAAFPVLIFPRRALTGLFGDWIPGCTLY